MLSSKIYHSFRKLIFILLSVAIYRETFAAAFNVLTNEQLTTILNELREKVNTDELKDSKFEATIANLEHEMETVKDKSDTNKKLIIKEINQTRDTLITVDRLEKVQFKHYCPQSSFTLQIQST